MLSLAPHLPLIDLPQHAGQVTLLRNFWDGDTQWEHLFNLNFFTPYLLGYVLAFLLSFLMPVATALNVLLALAFYGFVYANILLRRLFVGDSRLDWLFIPGYFGFAYTWGFFNFLVAAPLGLFFIVLAYHYANQPKLANGAILTVASMLLFVSHGLIFLFANSIGATFILIKHKSWKTRLITALPFCFAALLCVAFALMPMQTEITLSAGESSVCLWDWDISRLYFPFLAWSLSPLDLMLMPSGLLCFLAPFILQSTLNRRNIYAFLPIGCLLLIWLFAPSYAMKTSLLYQRFALFVLPCYAFMFCQPEQVAKSGYPKLRTRLCQSLLPLSCVIFLLIQTQRLVSFSYESADFTAVLASTEPGQRALALVFDKASPAAVNEKAYMHYPVWYQVEKQGLVDFNFAWFFPQIVHYKTAALPSVLPGFELEPEHFDWVKNQGYLYRYFFVRQSAPLAAAFFANQQCQVDLLKSVGKWSVYETKNCKV